MRRCPSCAAQLADGWRCSGCGWFAVECDGIPVLAPTHGGLPAGYPAELFDVLAGLEAGNFWFRSRNALILWALNRFLPDARSMLELGCGTGFVMSAITATHPEMTMVGSELFVAGAAIASRRVPSAEIVQMNATAMPFEEEFDVAGAFDVIEHIADDELALAELHRALRPDGGLMITVPQHPRMWSAADDHAQHQRRYTRRELTRKVRDAGFEIVCCTSFISVLLPLMAVSRLLRRGDEDHFDPLAEFKIGRTANWAFEKALTGERALIRAGVRFPAGGSLLLVATKI